MANSYYDPGARRAARVQDLFNRIASRYDLINDLQSFGLHRRWKRRVVALAQVTQGQRALDLCCGTGDIAFRLANAGAAVNGLDFTERMLTVAGQRKSQAPANEASRVQFLRGDAQRLPFRDESFDIVTVGYGLRNLADWETGLREMCRVSRPGGRILVLEFGKPDQPLWSALYFTYLKIFVPCLGLVCCGDPGVYAYILESLKHYPAQRGVAEKMRKLGLRNLQVINFIGGAMSLNYGER